MPVDHRSLGRNKPAIVESLLDHSAERVDRHCSPRCGMTRSWDYTCVVVSLRS
jgi:hypothetical protein